jgi:uroporphyrinogen decarboxylase-like protein
MTGRERVRAALRHQPSDRVPLDIGATPVTGVAASTVAKLRQKLGLDDTPVKIVEPYQILGEVATDLRQALGVDTINLWGRGNMFGFKNEKWKPWRLFDGTDVLVPGKFNTEPEPDGVIFQYPEGDKSVPPSARIPDGGYYFDAIVRQGPIDDAKLNPEDNTEEFKVLPDEEFRYYEEEAKHLYNNTDLAIVAVLPGLAFGDIALVPGPFMKHPKGIRDIEEWYVSTMVRKDYIKEVFDRQSEIAIENLARFYQAVGNKIEVIFTSGTDFGTQNGPFLGPETYRELYLPYQKRLNDWIHENTGWKTFQHSCGGVFPLIPLFIEAGYDILNPVQVSAADMDAKMLKQKYGKQTVFWGGGVDTQHTLPFGTPEEVYNQVKERIEIFSGGGGFIFNTIHNIQAKTPVENLIAMFEALGTLNK